MDPYEFMFREIAKRYGDVDPDAIRAILTPLLIPIWDLDTTIIKERGQNHYRASFSVVVTQETEQVLVRGRTGKFVPGTYVKGGPWREIAKGRIIEVRDDTAYGEVYTGSSSKQELIVRLSELSRGDYLEIDQYGAAAKVLSGLAEYYLAKRVREAGYAVRRMPEDMAKHLGTYPNYDFEFAKNGVTKRVEVKSLWGTDTRYARLIHSKTKGYKTSSCKFDTQDIFAVSLFLRTGNSQDFAFARSVPKDEKPYGLPRSTKCREYVHQNPSCEIGDGTWFAKIDDVWNLE